MHVCARVYVCAYERVCGVCVAYTYVCVRLCVCIIRKHTDAIYYMAYVWIHVFVYVMGGWYMWVLACGCVRACVHVRV